MLTIDVTLHMFKATHKYNIIHKIMALDEKCMDVCNSKEEDQQVRTTHNSFSSNESFGKSKNLWHLK